MDVAADQLDQLIDKRARGNEAENAREMIWKDSVRRFQARRREQRRWQWIRHHEHMCELHEDLAREHAQKAAALSAEEG